MKIDKKKFYIITMALTIIAYGIIIAVYIVTNNVLSTNKFAFPIIMAIICLIVSLIISRGFYKAYDTAITTEEHKDIMFKRIAKELELPLKTIDKYTQMYKSDLTEDIKAYYIDNIKMESQGLHKTISDILELEEVEKGNYELHEEAFSINKVLDEILDKYWNTADLKKIELVFSNVKETKVTADKFRMSQVIDNFIYNAIINAEKGRKIHTVMDERGMVLLSEGNQMSNEQIDNMWNLSYYKNEEDEEVKRSGIGMYISKKILLKQGYACGVENAQNGVKYWIKFSASNK